MWATLALSRVTNTDFLLSVALILHALDRLNAFVLQNRDAALESRNPFLDRLGSYDDGAAVQATKAMRT